MRYRLLVLILVVTASARAGEAVDLRVASRDVTVSKASRGGEVILFGMSVDVVGGVLTQRAMQTVVMDHDGDGVVQFLPSKPIALRTAVAAIDYRTGAFIVGSPDGYSLERRTFAATALKKNELDEFFALQGEWLSTRLLLVRPGHGAWVLDATDGWGGDSDRSRDGKLILSFETAKSLLGDPSAPKHVKKGDVIVVIEVGQLDVYAIEIGK